MTGRGSFALAGAAWRTTVVFATVVSLTALVWMRHQRSMDPWELPRWDPSRFTRIAGGSVTGLAGETWVVPVNLSCGSCFRRVERLAQNPPPARHAVLAVLIVDTPERPLADLLERRGVRHVYWDESQVWRRRWGHALYGEVLVFDREGALKATVPPGMSPRFRSRLRKELQVRKEGRE